MAIECLFDATSAPSSPEDLYTQLAFPEPPAHRPYIFLNMVATVDGKTLQGPRGSSAKGLGSATDQLLMRRLQNCADAAMLGAGTLRVGPVIYPPHLWRAVVTSTGDLPLENRFFVDAPHRVIIVAPHTLPEVTKHRLLHAEFQLILAGPSRVDLSRAVTLLREQFGIKKLLVEGGATLNFSFLEAGLMDELFLTIAPKVKGGATLPTVVDGPGLPADEVRRLELLSVYRAGSELYLRYRMAEGRRQGAER